MELCPNKSLLDYMNQRLATKLTETEILKIMYDITLAVSQMHYLSPPLLHRDIKIENVLVDANHNFKLCDFGSTSKCFPIATTHQDIAALGQDIYMHTTPQYRAPEMIDLYRCLPINEKSDIWALGIFLYKLLYFTTPFEVTGQFAILHSKYDMPPSKYSPKLTNLIIVMLAENPNLRPNIYQVLYHICSIIGVKVPIADIYGEGPYNFELYSNFQSKFQRVQFEVFDLERKRTDPSYRLTNQENMRLNDLFFSMFNVAPKIPFAVPSSGPSSTSEPQNVGVSAPASGSASTSNTAFIESTASFKDSSSTNKKIGDNSDHVGQLDTSSAQSEKVNVATTTTTTTTTVEDTTNATGPLDDNRSEEEIETFYPEVEDLDRYLTSEVSHVSSGQQVQQQQQQQQHYQPQPQHQYPQTVSPDANTYPSLLSQQLASAVPVAASVLPTEDQQQQVYLMPGPGYQVTTTVNQGSGSGSTVPVAGLKPHKSSNPFPQMQPDGKDQSQNLKNLNPAVSLPPAPPQQFMQFHGGGSPSRNYIPQPQEAPQLMRPVALNNILIPVPSLQQPLPPPPPPPPLSSSPTMPNNAAIFGSPKSQEINMSELNTKRDTTHMPVHIQQGSSHTRALPEKPIRSAKGSPLINNNVPMAMNPNESESSSSLSRASPHPHSRSKTPELEESLIDIGTLEPPPEPKRRPSDHRVHHVKATVPEVPSKERRKSRELRAGLTTESIDFDLDKYRRKSLEGKDQKIAHMSTTHLKDLQRKEEDLLKHPPSHFHGKGGEHVFAHLTEKSTPSVVDNDIIHNIKALRLSDSTGDINNNNNDGDSDSESSTSSDSVEDSLGIPAKDSEYSRVRGERGHRREEGLQVSASPIGPIIVGKAIDKARKSLDLERIRHEIPIVSDHGKKPSLFKKLRGEKR